MAVETKDERKTKSMNSQPLRSRSALISLLFRDSSSSFSHYFLILGSRQTRFFIPSLCHVWRAEEYQSLGGSNRTENPQ